MELGIECDPVPLSHRTRRRPVHRRSPIAREKSPRWKRQLRVLTGFLAPVVNSAASSRDDKVSSLCFGADPARIGEFATQFVKGVQDGEAAACLKYYPGPETDEEESPGMEPLKAGIAAGALSIMGNPFSIFRGLVRRRRLSGRLSRHSLH